MLEYSLTTTIITSIFLRLKHPLLLKEIESENLCQQKYEERLKEEDFGDTTYGRMRKYFWNLTEYPETSRAAQAYAFLSLFVVILSTVTFVLSTTPQLAPEMDLILFDIEEDNSTVTNPRAVERWEEVGSKSSKSRVKCGSSPSPQRRWRFSLEICICNVNGLIHGGVH